MNEIKQELDIIFIASYYQPTSNNTNGNRISNIIEGILTCIDAIRRRNCVDEKWQMY